MSEALKPAGAPWRLRIAMILLIAVATYVVWWTNQFLTERFTETTRSRAEVRLALYSGNILSELQRNQIVPQLLARDPTLIGALNSGDFTQSSQRLIEYRDEIAAEGLLLLDRVLGDGADEGVLVAASGERHAFADSKFGSCENSVVSSSYARSALVSPGL